jgi:hypothetical protein
MNLDYISKFLILLTNTFLLYKLIRLSLVVYKVGKWSVTTGQIRKSESKEESDGEYLVLLTTMHFHYIVNGIEYFGYRWSPLSERMYSKGIKKYKVGQTVEVVYNPNNPSESFLANLPLNQLAAHWVIYSLFTFVAILFCI